MNNFSFILSISFLLFAFIVSTPASAQRECNPSVVRINFNLHFKCGQFRGAEGRLYVRLKKSAWTPSANETDYLPLLDTVLDKTDNGIFNRSIYMEFGTQHLYSFEVFFRTNCYIMNRFGECCAHDFKFYVPIAIKGKPVIWNHHWFESNFHKEYTPKRKCEKNQFQGRDCTINFNTFDEKNVRGETNVIDFRELLVNAQYYLDERKKWIEQWGFEGKSKMAYRSKRLCSPVDDQWWKKAHLEKTEMDNFDFYENWKICDHPRYGLDISTFDRPEWKKYEGCKGDDGIPKKCECRKR